MGDSGAQQKHSGTYYDSNAIVPDRDLEAAGAIGPRKVDPALEPGQKFVVVEKTGSASSFESQYVAATRALKLERAEPASAYFSDIDRVEAAGFLREYVWSFLRQASWNAAPGGLDLPAFEAWRAEHLSNHKPVTHGRIAFRLASAQ